MSDRPLLNPAISAPITITTITPMATPRIVRAARTLWARSEASAIPTPSISGRMALLLPQGGDGVEPCRPARRVHARHDADAHPDHHAEENGEGRHGGRERARRVEQHAQPHARHDAER